MKKILVLLVAAALFACTQQTGFKINVSLEGAEGNIVLEQRAAGPGMGPRSGATGSDHARRFAPL